MDTEAHTKSRGVLLALAVHLLGSGLSLTVGAVLWWLTPATATAQTNDTIFPTTNTWWSPCDNSNVSAAEYCASDNAALFVFIESSVEWNTGASNIWSQLLNQYAPTDLGIFWESPPKYTGTSQTDIIYQSRTDLPTGVLGTTWCDEYKDAFGCDQHYIAFSTTMPSWGLACHESGHAVGLTHGAHAAPTLSNNATALECMRTPDTGVWTVGTLNTQNINNWY